LWAAVDVFEGYTLHRNEMNMIRWMDEWVYIERKEEKYTPQ